MLTPSQCDRLEVVLVSPRNPLNIGAVARAMANFGLSRLTVVTPWEPSWRDARSAVGAPELLENAREVSTVDEAVAACSLVVGTGCLTYRKPEQPILPLPDLPPVLRRAWDQDGRIALIFGPENHGLSRDDLSWCHLFTVIPTASGQPSMNLGQAAAVCFYQLSNCVNFAEYNDVSSIEIPRKTESLLPLAESIDSSAPSAQLDRLAGLIEESMFAAGYSPRSMQAANHHDLRLLLRRLAPHSQDTRRMMGLFRRILWRLQHREPSRR